MILDEYGWLVEVDMVVVRFYYYFVFNMEKICEVGYEVCDDVLYVEICKFGDCNLVIN